MHSGVDNSLKEISLQIRQNYVHSLTNIEKALKLSTPLQQPSLPIFSEYVLIVWHRPKKNTKNFWRTDDGKNYYSFRTWDDINTELYVHCFLSEKSIKFSWYKNGLVVDAGAKWRVIVILQFLWTILYTILTVKSYFWILIEVSYIKLTRFSHYKLYISNL